MRQGVDPTPSGYQLVLELRYHRSCSVSMACKKASPRSITSSTPRALPRWRRANRAQPGAQPLQQRQCLDQGLEIEHAGEISAYRGRLGVVAVSETCNKRIAIHIHGQLYRAMMGRQRCRLPRRSALASLASHCGCPLKSPVQRGPMFCTSETETVKASRA